MTDLDALIEAFPHDPAARRELIAFRADQDPEASLDANVEWLMFSAIDGGAVADVYEWADAVCDAAFARKWDRKDRFDAFPAVLGEALTKLWRGARRRKNPHFGGRGLGMSAKSLEWLEVLFSSGWEVTVSRRPDGSFVVVVNNRSGRPRTLDGFQRRSPDTFVGNTLDDALNKAVRG
jgi:hypothetical protein